MELDEFKILEKLEAKLSVILPTDLKNQSDRILLYGYTSARDTFYVELASGSIYVFDGLKAPKRHNEIRSNAEYIPSKRTYPDRSDYEFCKLLIEAGERIIFTTFKDNE